MLKGFFDSKDEEKKNRKSRSVIGQYSNQGMNPNYIVAKYAKMKESGLL